MPPSKKRSAPNIDDIRILAKVLEECALTEIEYSSDDIKIRVSKQIYNSPSQVGNSNICLAGDGRKLVTKPVKESVSEDLLYQDLAALPGLVKSPMVGVVYLSPDPGAPPFVTVGEIVDCGDILVLIEAMKVFNPIKSPVAGKVARILVSHGVPVEYDEPLMVIE